MALLHVDTSIYKRTVGVEMDANLYKREKRRIERIREQARNHPNPLDPDCPDIDWDELDEYERYIDSLVE